MNFDFATGRVRVEFSDGDPVVDPACAPEHSPGYFQLEPVLVAGSNTTFSGRVVATRELGWTASLHRPGGLPLLSIDVVGPPPMAVGALAAECIQIKHAEGIRIPPAPGSAGALLLNQFLKWASELTRDGGGT